MNKTIAFIVRDPLPAKRADLLTLFGHELPRYGIYSALIGQAATEGGALSWRAGPLSVVGAFSRRFSSVMTPLWDMVGLWRVLRGNSIDCIQVRDKIASGLCALIVARILRLPYVYWMSFPIVEGYGVRARDLGNSHGRFVALAHRLRAAISRWVFYSLLLRNADHIFVQSEAMLDWLAGKGLPKARMTPVPMGVDRDLFQRELVLPVKDPRFLGRRVIVYVGVLGRARQSVFLLELLIALRSAEPDVLLVLAGDAVSPDERDWIRREVASRELESHVLITGWLSQSEAIRYALAAEVALSPVPRGELFDVSSPTKLIEYMALGVPSVANDIPDQQLVIERSGAGLCVQMTVPAFCEAVLHLLRNPDLRQHCSEVGPKYVSNERTYDRLGADVADAYKRLWQQQDVI